MIRGGGKVRGEDGGWGGKALCTSSCGYSVHVWLVKTRSIQRWGGGNPTEAK